MNQLKWLFTLLLITSNMVFAYQNNEHSARGIPTLEELEDKIHKLNLEYQKAAAAFNPWYAGPLLTPSAHCVPAGKFNVQPYWFYTRITEIFDSTRKKIASTSTTQNVVQVVLQAGVIDRVDFNVVIGTEVTHQNHETKAGYQDTVAEFGFQVLDEQHYRPAVRAVAGVTFPTGRYKNLSPILRGIDASGSGAYEATLGLVMSKVVWWITPHPFQYRFALQYSIPGDANVKGFHAYGGGFGTKGKVDIGKSLNALSSLEYSITKQWVFALDFAFNYRNKTTFNGVAGVTPEGTVAGNSAPSSYVLSVAPALEYNVSGTLGFLLGGQTVLWGRNTTDASSLVATFTYAW